MLEKTTHNFIAEDAADKLIAAHDGDLALLYLYVCRTGCRDLDRAARDLCRTMGQMREAEEKLQRLGLLDAAAPAAAPKAAAAADILPEADELPQYTAEEISRRTRSDSAFQAVIADAEKAMGRKLSSNDLRILFGIYDALGLPADVIMMLLTYCAERNEIKYEGRRRLTARFVETEAYAWVHREILTIEQAEEYIHAQHQRRSEQGRIAAAMEIRGRSPSPTEAQYIEKWLGMGFEAEAVAIAYDRTVTKTGQRPLRYMNSILESWHKKGLHSPAEIEAKDGKGGRGRNNGGAVEAADISGLDDIISKI